MAYAGYDDDGNHFIITNGDKKVFVSGLKTMTPDGRAAIDLAVGVGEIKENDRENWDVRQVCWDELQRLQI